MKSLTALIYLTAFSLHGQVWVLFYGTQPTNSIARILNVPTNMPMEVSSGSRSSPYAQFDLISWNAYSASNQAVWDSWITNTWNPYDLSNRLALAAVQIQSANSNYALWNAMYAQIPQGISDSSNRVVTLGSLLASFNSGTNNAAGTNNIIRQTIQNAQVSYQYLNQIIVYLSRLGPGLQSVYQPANDPVGH